MANEIKSWEVLAYLIPDGGYVQVGQDYEGIQFIDCEPITKEEFEQGFTDYAAWKAEKEAALAKEKESILNRLGITEDEAKLLLG